MEFLPDPFFYPILGTPIWFWGVFLLLVPLILAFDLGLMNRKDRELGYKESLRLTSIYVSLALAFGGWVWHTLGRANGLDYYTSYLVEYSLSMDNIFMISVVFAYFKIPREYQHRVLFWGILGVVLLRGTMITLGTAILQHFSWLLLLFGAFLIFSGFKMLIHGEDDDGDLENSRIVRFLEKHLRVTRIIDGNKFFLRLNSPKHGKMVRYATPLFLALVTVELVDVVFAVDSIPAVFVVTTNTFVVFSSNIFAVLGLRTLYFLLAAMVNQFKYLPAAVSIVLIFIGGKVFYNEFFGHVDSMLSLTITLVVLGAGMAMSLLHRKKEIAGDD